MSEFFKITNLKKKPESYVAWPPYTVVGQHSTHFSYDSYQ